MSRIVSAIAGALVLVAASPACAARTLEPAPAPGVRIELRSKQTVAYSEAPGSTVALVIEQASWDTYDRPVLILSLANAGGKPLRVEPAAITLVGADGRPVAMQSVEEARAEAAKMAEKAAETRMSTGYAAAETRFSATNGGLAATPAKGMVGLADALDNMKSGQVFHRTGGGPAEIGLQAFTLAPGAVETLYIPLRKLARTDADMTLKVVLGADTHVLPLKAGR